MCSALSDKTAVTGGWLSGGGNSGTSSGGGSSESATVTACLAGVKGGLTLQGINIFDDSNKREWRHLFILNKIIPDNVFNCAQLAGQTS